MAAAAVPDAPVVCPGHTRPISEICFSDVTPEGVFFIAGSVDQKPMLREGRTGDWIGTFDGHTGAVWSAKMNKAATHCVTGSADFSIRLWDAIKGVQSAAFAGGHVVKAVTFSHDEKTIIAGGYSKQLMVFAVSRPGAPVLTVPHPTRIRKLAALPSGFVATGDEEGTLRMFTLEAGGKQLDELRMDGIIGEVHDLTVVKPTDGGPLTSGGLIACVGRWVLLLRVSEEGKLAVAHKLRTPFLARVDSASIHQDGLHLVLGGGDAASAATTKGGVASLYVFLVKLINPAAAAGAAGSPAKGSYAATATSAGAPPAAAAEAAASVKRRAFVGCELLSISKGHVGPIRCLRFSPDGERFASGGEDGNIRLWSFAAQLRAGSGGADDLPAVNDKGTPLDSGAAGAAERKAAAVKSSGAYRPGAFGRAKRQ